MRIEINLSDMRINGDAQILNRATIQGSQDVGIKLNNLEVNGKAVVFDDLKINSILEELNASVQRMDKNSDEYYKIQDMLQEKQWNEKKFIKCVKEHVSNFSQGVLASIVANFLTNL